MDVSGSSNQSMAHVTSSSVCVCVCARARACVCVCACVVTSKVVDWLAGDRLGESGGEKRSKRAILDSLKEFAPAPLHPQPSPPCAGPRRRAGACGRVANAVGLSEPLGFRRRRRRSSISQGRPSVFCGGHHGEIFRKCRQSIPALPQQHTPAGE